VVEVSVARAEEESVLYHQRRDPHVVRRDRRSLLAKLAVDSSVKMSRFLVRIQCTYARTVEELHEQALVPLASSTTGETGAKLRKGDEREIDRAGFLYSLENRWVVTRVVFVSVRVEEDAHATASLPKLRVDDAHVAKRLFHGRVLHPLPCEMVEIVMQDLLFGLPQRFLDGLDCRLVQADAFLLGAAAQRLVHVLGDAA